LLLLLCFPPLSLHLLPLLVRGFDLRIVSDQLLLRNGVFNALKDGGDGADVVRLAFIITKAWRAVLLQFGTPLGRGWGAVALDDAATELSAIYGRWVRNKGQLAHRFVDSWT